MQNPYCDRRLKAGAARLFGLLASKNPHRGCWAKRETLAAMAGLSKGTIDQYLSLLARYGYVTVRRRGPGKPAKLFLNPAALAAAGIAPAKKAAPAPKPKAPPAVLAIVSSAQADTREQESRCLRAVSYTAFSADPSDPPLVSEKREKSADLNCVSNPSCSKTPRKSQNRNPNNQPSAIAGTKAGPKAPRDVVLAESFSGFSESQKPNAVGRGANPLVSRSSGQGGGPSRRPGALSDAESELCDHKKTLVRLCTDQGISRPVAISLAETSTERQLHAAIQYAHSYRGSRVHIPGLIVSAIRDRYSFPADCYPTEKKPKKAQSVSTVLDGQSVSDDAFWRKVLGPDRYTEAMATIGNDPV